MADVTGPVTTLPGSRRKVPPGTICDSCDEPAITRIQGETDSFGAEFADVCQVHLDELLGAESDTSGKCDWCGNEVESRSPRRDSDEGMHGPVYFVCAPCADQDHEALAREAEFYDEY